MEDNKVLLAIATELKEIKAKIDQPKPNSEETESKDTSLEYVASTEQRFINLNKKLDSILLHQRKSNTEQRILIWASVLFAIIFSVRLAHDIFIRVINTL
jgi:hypothetical protein